MLALHAHFVCGKDIEMIMWTIGVESLLLACIKPIKILSYIL